MLLLSLSFSPPFTPLLWTHHKEEESRKSVWRDWWERKGKKKEGSLVVLIDELIFPVIL